MLKFHDSDNPWPDFCVPREWMYSVVHPFSFHILWKCKMSLVGGRWMKHDDCRMVDSQGVYSKAGFLVRPTTCT